jgi:hypothetical protein
MSSSGAAAPRQVRFDILVFVSYIIFNHAFIRFVEDHMKIRRTDKPALHWLPRIFGICFTLFIGMFSLDVYTPGMKFIHLAIGTAIHLIPCFLIAIALGFAWKRPLVGAVTFPVLGAGFLLFFRKVPVPVHAVIAGPLFLIGILFLAEWLGRRKEPGRE